MDKLKRRQEMGKTNAEILAAVDQKQIDELVDAIINARRIFVSGWGRAGNIVRILGMNMSQLGMNVFCVGDNNTPSIHERDLLIIFSGSGNTKTISLICQQGKDHGAKVCLISGNADSTMGKIADINVVIPASQWNEEKPGEEHSEIRGLNVYQVAFMLNDFIEECVMERLGKTFEDVKFFHNNLE